MTGYGILGDDPETKIAQMVHEYMQDMHDRLCDNKKSILDFVQYHDELIEEIYQRLHRYERAAIDIRAQYSLQPFRWQTEKIDTIRDIISGKGIGPLDRHDGKERREKIARYRQTEQRWPDYPVVKLKPEFQGENHTLYVPPDYNHKG